MKGPQWNSWPTESLKGDFAGRTPKSGFNDAGGLFTASTVRCTDSDLAIPISPKRLAFVMRLDESIELATLNQNSEFTNHLRCFLADGHHTHAEPLPCPSGVVPEGFFLREFYGYKVATRCAAGVCR